MSNTIGVPAQAQVPGTGGRPQPWRTDQLPPVLHEIRTVDRRKLCVRLIRPGDAFGLYARLNGTPLVEVRRSGRVEAAFNVPGELVAVWDLTLFLEEPRAHWLILTEGMRFACTEDELCGMYAAIHDAGVPAVEAGD